jgi:hypothetical protein
VDSS